jgi:hypothetical protein
VTSEEYFGWMPRLDSLSADELCVHINGSYVEVNSYLEALEQFIAEHEAPAE